jgi:hypothetical protein
LAARVEALPTKRLLALMLAIFGLVQTGYLLLGIRFDVSQLLFGTHILDPELLRGRLAESLLYLHSQPPLFNLFLGVVLKLFPHHEALAFAIVYLAMGLGLYLALLALMRRAGVSQALALLLSTWFMASPSFVLYEQWLLYTLPLALLMTLSCLLFSSSLARPRFRPLFGLFGAVLLMCALWSMFHLVYFLLVMTALLALRWRNRRAIVAAALAPLLLLVGLYVKNGVLFGQVTMNSWLGMNLSGVTVRAVPVETRRTLVEEGKLTPLAMIPRFSELSAYPAPYAQVRGFEHIAALRQRRKSTGANNYHHLAYIAISKEYLRNDLYVALHRPKYLLVGWLNSWLCYFRSGTDYPLLYGNLSKIAPVNVLYDYLFYGKVPRYRLHLGGIPVYYAAPWAQPRLYLFLLIGLPLLLLFGFRLALRPRRTGLVLSADQRMLLLYVCLNILFVALVGNTLDVGENHRFRFATDPLYLLLLGLVIEQARWRKAPSQSREQRGGRHAEQESRTR